MEITILFPKLIVYLDPQRTILEFRNGKKTERTPRQDSKENGRKGLRIGIF